MTETYRDKIDDALADMVVALHPIVIQELDKNRVKPWRAELEQWSRGGWKAQNDLDASALLSAVLCFWDDVFKIQFAEDARSYVYLVRGTRNKLAHSHKYSNDFSSRDDVYRRLDQISELLVAAGAGSSEQASNLDEYKLALRKEELTDQLKMADEFDRQEREKLQARYDEDIREFGKRSEQEHQEMQVIFDRRLRKAKQPFRNRVVVAVGVALIPSIVLGYFVVHISSDSENIEHELVQAKREVRRASDEADRLHVQLSGEAQIEDARYKSISRRYRGITSGNITHDGLSDLKTRCSDFLKDYPSSTLRRDAVRRLRDWLDNVLSAHPKVKLIPVGFHVYRDPWGLNPLEVLTCQIRVGGDFVNEISRAYISEEFKGEFSLEREEPLIIDWHPSGQVQIIFGPEKHPQVGKHFIDLNSFSILQGKLGGEQVVKSKPKGWYGFKYRLERVDFNPLPELQF